MMCSSEAGNRWRKKKKTCSGINLQDCAEVITDGNNLSVRLIGEFVPEGLITSFKLVVLHTRVKV